MTMIRTTLLATLAAGGILAAGCGGDDDKGLAKADLAKKADAICVKYDAKQKAIPEPTSQAEVGPYLDKALPIGEAMGKEIHGLKPNDDVKDEWNGLVASYDKNIDLLKQAGEAIKANDTAKFQTLSEEASKLNDESSKKLDAFGAPHCGSQSQT